MIKPIYPEIVISTPAEIREIRRILNKTQKEFARYFNISDAAIKAWENGWRNPYGPSGVILQQLKVYTDHVKSEKEAAVKRFLKKQPGVKS